MITKVLMDLGPLKGSEASDKDTVMVDFSKMTQPTSGSANITKGASEGKSLTKVKGAIEKVFKTPLTPVSVTLTFKEGGGSYAAENNSNDLVATIVFTANSGYEFDTTITDETAYNYDGSKTPATATLTLNIKLPKSNSWTK